MYPIACRPKSSPVVAVAAPATPTNLAAAGGTGVTSVTWTASAGATSYDLRYSSDNATWTNLIGVTSAYSDTAAKTTIAASGLVYYQVRAINSGGTSAWSSSASVGLDITSLTPLTWLRADGTLFQDTAGTTPATADTDPVARINDAAPTPLNQTQATAGRRPLLKLNIQNGLPILRADGTDDLLINASASAYNVLHNGAGVTVLYAGKKTAADGTSTGLVGNNSNTTANIGFANTMLSGNLTTLIVKGSAGNAVINKTTTVAANVFFLAGWRYKTGASPAAFRIRVNGGADATSAELNAPTASNASSGVGLMSTNSGATGLFAAQDFGEWLVIPSDLIDADMAKLMVYANIRWGVY